MFVAVHKISLLEKNVGLTFTQTGYPKRKTDGQHMGEIV